MAILDKDVYWAAQPSEDVGRQIMKRIEEYYSYIRKIGRLSLWRRMYDYYYSSIRTGGRVYYTGEIDEYTNIDVNDLRNILMHLKSMIMGQRIAFDPQAINTDHESQSQVILAKSVVENELRKGSLDWVADKGVEFALFLADGFIELDWDPNKGDEYTTQGESIVHEGGLEAWVYNPLDAIIDHTLTEPRHTWIITRKFQNRYDLKMAYPDLEDEIMNISLGIEEKDTVFGMNLTEPTDLIPVYTLHHNRTPAVPDGRIVQLVGPDAVLFEGPYPYKSRQIYHIQPSNQTGTPFGYSVGFDLLPLAEAQNSLYSTVATNQSNFGVQNILVPAGHNLSVTSISEGLNFVEYDPESGKPEALNLTFTPKEIFDFIIMIREKMESLAGVSSVARNTAKVGDLSGSAMALLQATAIQFNSDLQKAYAKMMEKLGTGVIEIYQEYAKTERVATIVGKANKPLMKSWTNQDLDRITRVTVDLGNPLTRTTAGKVNMAENLLTAGLVENPDQYIEVLETGRLEPLIEGKRAELLNIKSENEELSEGNELPAVFTDNHAMHITEHKAVLAAPDARRNPKIVTAVLKHMQQHLDLLRSTDPAMLALLGQQPMPPAQPAAAPQNGVPPPPQATTGVEPIGDSGTRMPNMPNMPTNPMTGEKFDLAGGI